MYWRLIIAPVAVVQIAYHTDKVIGYISIIGINNAPSSLSIPFAHSLTSSLSSATLCCSDSSRNFFLILLLFACSLFLSLLSTFCCSDIFRSCGRGRFLDLEELDDLAEEEEDFGGTGVVT